MVCNRCKLIVENELRAVGISPGLVTLGSVELSKQPTKKQMVLLNERLKAYGFEILDDQNQKTIEKVKTLLIEKIQELNIEEHFSIKEFIGKKLLKDYTSVSKLFSQTEGVTIEQFFILQKIEKAKELLFYNELTLSEISWKLGYSSVQHLSAQFKKITGLTPTRLKNLAGRHRKPLDEII